MLSIICTIEGRENGQLDTYSDSIISILLDLNMLNDPATKRFLTLFVWTIKSSSSSPTIKMDS